MNTAPGRFWLRAFLCILIALGVVLHLGQTAPALADTGMSQLFTADQRNSSCETDHGLTAVHCHVTTACALYAPLEAHPILLVQDANHPSPVTEAVHASWAASPQLQPPQDSLLA